MYARILKFLTNLLFKRIFRGFLTPRKKREPALWNSCWICGFGFLAFNKRQKICVRKSCRKVHRANQYRIELVQKRLEVNKALVSQRDPSDLESEE